MRKLMALVVLLCGAASADAADSVSSWCSAGFDAPAILTNNQGFVLKVGNKTERLGDGRSFGTGMNGRVFPNGDLLSTAEFAAASGPNGPEEVIPILLFRDRVFWPCD